MIPTRDELERLAFTAAGDLALTPFPLLLVAHAALGRSLQLEVSRGPVSKVITIVDGTPVDCQSNLLQDTLGRYLVARGQLSEQQFESLQAQSLATGRPFEELLAAGGSVEPEVLGRSQQQLLARKLLDAFAWDRGEFRCAPLDFAPEPALKIKLPQLLVMGIEKLAPLAQVSAALAACAGRPLFLNPQPTFPLTDLRLNPRQQAVIDGLRSGKRLDELDPTGTDARTERFLYALGLLGLLALEPPAAAKVREAKAEPSPAAMVATPEGPQPPAAPPRPGGVPPAPAPSSIAPPPPVVATPPIPAPPRATAAPAVAEHRRNLLELYERHKALDAYDLLGATPGATQGENEQAFLSYCERVAPWTFGGGDIESKARELFLAGARAFADLSDPERRTSIEARRQSPIAAAQEARKGAREGFKIQTALLDPRTQHQKGVALMEKKRYAEALEQLQYAVDCDPQNAVFRAELARCHWLSQPQARARGSVRDLEEATQIDPECGLAFLYLGEIQAWLERYDEARVALKRAAHLLLPDRRAVEMLNALPAPGKKGKVAGKIGKWF